MDPSAEVAGHEQGKAQLPSPVVREELAAIEAWVAGSVDEERREEAAVSASERSYEETIDAALGWCLALASG